MAFDDLTVECGYRFELDSAFAEIARVLRPGGTFAAWCYGLPEVGDNSTATDLIHHLRFGHDALGPYWSERNKLVDEEYASIVPDPTLYRSVTRRRLYGHQQTTLDNLVGLLLQNPLRQEYRGGSWRDNASPPCPTNML